MPGASTKTYGLVFLAVAVGIGFQVLISRTRFGFDLRATGRSASAAQASGVNVKRMVLLTMLLSGAVAGLVGHADTCSATRTPTHWTSRPGSGSPASPSRCWAATTRSASRSARCCGRSSTSPRCILDINNIPKEIVQITQGVVVLSVVIAYEVVRRLALVRQQRLVGRTLASSPPGASTPEPIGAST